ncbi:hypothetical protein NIES267_14730 [Calothrix parasitica NIES-267]|uniref:Uncharacterized protein n=1 Tax=Calothrix parasitica NIES-267 TaxID=1973488 RepID=A0A1Z4LLA3_9CYAN|nr:hypothetical protein NIES267_14730 [Calothrix parasitica NIES-267]
MSVDYWWFFIHLSSEEETKILPFYQDALQKAVLSDSSTDILQQWRDNPETFIFANHKNNDFLFYNRFIWAFIVPSFQNFGEQLISEKLIPEWELNENNCFELISVNRCSPVAALFYALKPEIADRIPGLMGNMFIRQHEIKQALNLVEEIFNKIDYQTLNFQASSLIMGTHDASNILNALPKALTSANKKGCSLLTLAMVPW